MKKVALLQKLICLLLVFAFLFSVCVGCKRPDDLDPNKVYEDDLTQPHTIKYYMPNVGGTGVNLIPDLPKVVVELNKILKEKINAEIQIVSYGYNDYSTKMQGIIGAGVEFDICYTAPTLNHYFLNIQRQAFLPLDTLLPTYAPTAYAMFEEDIWNQTKVDGHIYGVINRQIMARGPGMQIHNKALFEEFLAEEYPDYTFDTFYQAEGHPLAKIEKYLDWCAENGKGNGGKMFNSNAIYLFQTLYGLDDLTSNIMTPGVVRISDDASDGMTVINQFDCEEMEEFLSYIYRFIDKGYIPKKGTYPGAWEGYECMPDSTYKPGQLVQYMNSGELLTRETVRLGEMNYYTSYILSTMNAISSTSKNPARAMRFIELLFTDKEIHNLLQYGIEGEHYTKDPENPERINFVENTRYDNRKFGWGLGDEFMSYLQPGQVDNQWELYKEINDTAGVPEVIGFNFDMEPVKQKIADCQALFTQYMDNIFLGAYPDPQSALEEFRSELVAAGSNEVIAEKQRQLDAWLAQK